MSQKSRILFLTLVASVLVVLICGLAAAGAYIAGRNSVEMASAPESTREVRAEEEDTPAVADEADPGQDGELVEGATDRTEPLGPDALTIEPSPGSSPAVAAPQNLDLDLEGDDLELVLEVWEIIGREFDGELPSDSEVTYGAIRGSLELLQDQFTRFVPPEVAERAREQLDGSFEGIGAFVDLDSNGYLLIIRPIEGQPADRAGLLSGDWVTHINGDSVLGKTLDEMIAEVKGPKGTSVTLTIHREPESEEFDVTIVRDRIEIPIVESEMMDNDIAYVRLTSFSSNAATQLAEALETVLAQEPQALILDLRDNPGGFLNQSVAVADLFLPEGVVLFQRDRLGAEEVFESDDGDVAEEVPLVVLINAGSASASEIVAGAIKDRDRGILIGEVTFGKGSVQQTHTLSDGSELRVTIARWYTPSDHSIDQQGVMPDVEVETPSEFGGDADTQLNRALEYVMSGE